MGQDETHGAAAPAPAGTAGARVVGLDVARAVAICLMILENFKVLMLGQRQDPHALVWLAGVTDGRSAPLFVMLAGVGVALLSGPARAAEAGGASGALWGARRVLLLRALVLLGLGNLFRLVWYMDILHFYAVYIALAALLFLAMSGPRLLVSAAVVVGAATIELVWRREAFFEYVDYWTPTGVVRDTFLDGIHPVLPWLAFVLVGMWLGRLDLSSARTRWRLLRWALATWVVTELLSIALNELAFARGLDILPPWFPHLWATRLSPPGPLYMVSASATSIAAVAACLLLAERFGRSRLVRAMASAGQLSLTLYIGHAIVGAGLLWALGALEDHSIWFLLAYWAGYTALSVLFATWYRTRFRLGPFEWIMRRLSGPVPGRAGPEPAAGEASPPQERVAPVRAPAGWLVVVGLGAAALLYSSFFGLGAPRVGCPDVAEPLRPGDSFVGELTALCRDQWVEIELAEPRDITFSTSSGLDIYLEVHERPGGREPVAVDDDSGPGFNARLTRRQGAGRAAILLHPWRAGTGPYVLRVE
jgi:uncharacterized membrane protein YeiB